jgi:hypothetical protein
VFLKETTSSTASMSGLPSSFLAVAAGALAFIAIGYALAAVGPHNAETIIRGAHPILLPNPVGVYPKPLDQFLVLSLTLAVPVVMAGIAALARSLGASASDPKPIFWSLTCVILLICILKGAAPELGRFLSGWQWLVTLACGLIGYALVAAPSRAYPLTNTGLMIIALAVSALMIASQRVLTLSSVVYAGGHFPSHYEAATSALVRIAAGGTCLVDVIPQYGCFGEFLAPVLRVFGSGVFVVTTLFAALLIAALASAMFFARTILDRPVVLAGCLCSLMIAAALNSIYDNPDPILQYFPLRFVFPSLSLLLAVWFQRAPSVKRSLLLGAFSGAALSWNLESGVAVTGALAWFVTLGTFTAREWQHRRGLAELAGRLAAFLAGAVVFVMIFIAYLSAKSSSSIDLGNYIIFQRVFYITGFGMLPLPRFPDYWTIHIGIIFCTLALGALWLGSAKAGSDPKLELAVYLAILAIGLFFYYSGRSHIFVLRLVAWPSVILFFFLLERATAATRTRAGLALIGAAGLVSYALPSAFLLYTMPAVAKLASVARSAPPAQNAAVREDIAFIKSVAAPHEAIAIVAVNQGILYGETGMRAALEGPGVAEMLRRVDRDDQVKMLVERGPDKLFVGTTLSGHSLLGTDIDLDLDQIQTAYTLEATGPGGRLLFFRRRRSHPVASK